MSEREDLLLAVSKTCEAIYTEINELKQRFDMLESHLGIVPDLSCQIDDIELSVTNFKIYCSDKLNLSARTIKMYGDSIQKFLYFSSGEISNETVQVYIDSNSSQSWRNQELKALRSYCRKFLSLGAWIEGFDIINIDKVNRKEMPNDLELAEFYHQLQGLSEMVFLVLHDSGLRLDEVLKAKLRNWNESTQCLDVSEIHQGDSKSSFKSFVTYGTRNVIEEYLNLSDYRVDNDKLFPISARGVELEFQRVSNEIGIPLTPKDLRKIFVTKLSNADIKDRFIDCMQGRIPKKVIAKHYTDYSVDNLKVQYDKADLTLPL